MAKEESIFDRRMGTTLDEFLVDTAIEMSERKIDGIIFDDTKNYSKEDRKNIMKRMIKGEKIKIGERRINIYGLGR